MSEEKWRPIDEDVPKDAWVVLWCAGAEVPGIGRYVKPGVFESWDGGIYYTRGAHYMPLPTPPERSE